MKTKRVALAFSGGKDSTAAALLLRERGFEVQAATMRLGIAGEEERLEAAAKLAQRIGVPWRALDLSREFREEVLDYFLSEYRAGRTPNPCLVCNRRIKFGLLFSRLAGAAGAGFFATGHYAAVEAVAGGLFLAEPAERRKSQIYFLSQIEPGALRRTIFPLAGMRLEQVRGRVAGLPLANAEESQDACFLAGQDLPGFLRRHIPEANAPGDILDPDGRVIGRHEGVVHYTIGQRRGTRFASGRRLYVVAVDARKRTVTLGEERQLLAGGLTAGAPVYWRSLAAGERLRVKVRYAAPGQEAEVLVASDTELSLRFPEPLRAPAPGQFAVLYEGDRIVASAAIESVDKA